MCIKKIVNVSVTLELVISPVKLFIAKWFYIIVFILLFMYAILLLLKRILDKL